MPKMPKVITHKNLESILKELRTDFSSTATPIRNVKHWYTIVTLECPIGEFAESPLKTLALRGFANVICLPIDGTEGFNAQGLEGKGQVCQSLFNALINMRDNLAPFRGRIITR